MENKSKNLITNLINSFQKDRHSKKNAKIDNKNQSKKDVSSLKVQINNNSLFSDKHINEIDEKTPDSYIVGVYNPSDSDLVYNNSSDSDAFYKSVSSDNDIIISSTDSDSSNNNENSKKRRKSRKHRPKHAFLQISRSKSRSKSQSPNPKFSNYVDNNNYKRKKMVERFMQKKYREDAFRECTLYGFLRRNDEKTIYSFNMENSEILSRISFHDEARAKILQQTIAYVITSWKKLNEINMINCEMDDHFLKTICKSLIKNKTNWKIDTIDISCNYITTDGIKWVTELIKLQKECLTTIIIKDNKCRISSDDRKYLLKAIKKNIYVLKFETNIFENKTERKKLKKYLERNNKGVLKKIIRNIF